MSGEPPEVSPGDVEPRTTRMLDTAASPPTERLPENEGPPEISRFLDPLPSAPRPSEPPPSSGNMRRRSRRTVKIPTDAIAQAAAQAPLTVAEAPVPAIPPAPPVPSTRVAPTLPAVPRPAPRPAASAPPPEPPKPAAQPATDGAARPAEEVVAKAEEEVFEVIRPMRIISIDATPPSIPAPAPAATPASTPPAAPSAPPPAALADGAAQAPAKPPPPKPPVVEEVEAVEEADEPVTVVSPSPLEAEVPRAARTDEIEPIPLDEVDDHEVGERISEADIAVHAEPAADAHVEVSVDVDDTPKPKKPPPPPPKRQPSTESPVVGTVLAEDARPAASPAKPPPPPSAPATAAQAAAPVISAAPASSPAPSQSVPTLDLAGKRRQKPWWEEIFSDDFIRTMEKVEPRVITKECDFIEDRLGLEKGAVMLDLACGAGLHAVELASRGYNVVGYDLSLAMLARAQDEAQDRGQKINFLQGDMREMAFEEAFDGMFSWSTSFGYFDDEKNLNVLSRVYRGLRQGGMFLLDVINRDYVCPRQPSLVWFEGEGCVCMDEMHVDFFTSRLRVKRTVMFEDGRSRECDYAIRLYGLNDLGKMLHDTGFKVVEVTGHPAHPGVFFGSESPRIIILAERS